MKKLIIARHGRYDEDTLGLTNYGREDVLRLAEKLRSMIKAHSVFVLASNAKRADESAQIIGRVFNVTAELSQVLFSSSASYPRLKEALDLVVEKGKSFDVVIVVTHLEFTELFPTYFARSILKNESIGSYAIKNASAWLIDCQQESIELIL